MKKIMLFAAACAALAACNKNIESTTPKLDNPNAFVKGQEVTLTVSAGAQTKVSSELVTSGTDKDKVNFKWEAGDKILVTVNSKTAEFTLSSGAGQSSATFIGTMPDSGTTFDVQYPCTTPTLSEQTYSSSEALPKDKMLFKKTGCTKESAFELEPQYSALRLRFYSGDSNAILGKIQVAIDDSDTYTLDCGGADGVNVYATEENAKDFFLVVRPAKNKLFFVDFFYGNSAEKGVPLSKADVDFTVGEITFMSALKLTVFNIEEKSDYLSGTFFSPSYYDTEIEEDFKGWPGFCINHQDVLSEEKYFPKPIHPKNHNDITLYDPVDKCNVCPDTDVIKSCTYVWK